MSWNLPALSSLRAFEAAARHASFADAGAELFVTPGAVSRQIKSLEDFFGKQVFKRGHRRVELTPEGAVYAAAVKEAFERLQAATTRFSGTAANSVHVVCPLTFLGRWLIPHISGFMEYAPDLQVKFSTAMSSEPYTDADVLITLGGPESHAPGLERHLLFQSKLIPVASAAMAATLHSVDDLRNARLLHSTLRPTAWANWAQGAGVDLAQGEGMDFSNLALAYQAAVDGVGVAVGEVDLLADDLASGKLVCPFGPVVRSGAGYWLVYPTRLAGDPRIVRFKDWITSVAQAAEAAEAWAKYIPANKDMTPERAQAAGR